MDGFVRNGSMRRLLLIFILLLALSAGLSFLIADKCAEKIVSAQIEAELSAIGGGKFSALPDEASIAAGEEIMKEYGINRELEPKIMRCYNSVRMTVFTSLFALTALISVLWLVVSLRELAAICRDLERLRTDCIAASDNSDHHIGLYGRDLDSVRRVSEGAELLLRRINHLNSKLSQEQRFLRTFLTDLSHQIKTSLAVVRLNTDMLSELDNIPEERRQQLSEEIQISLDAMEQLVIEAIKLAKLNADAVEYRMEDNSPADICNTVLKRLAPMLRKNNISVRTDLDSSVRLICDKGWLCEAVENIIKNSADHSECTEISAETKNDPLMITIALSDNGKGIPQSDIPKLFERFSSGSNDRTMYSSGLGMSIAHRIVTDNGGEILVYSEESKGTRFELVFLKN
ncbi:sensor histidine kinase [Ruminococcus flavefaciens]|uniref:histidine kinase n=1 Tax=Ruminococcus flavefaciens 007c TaxID=1341157 RepID=W7UIC6_RUMFL|nr:HAMP domain-containing sensor histidine kinase [Ruminococcus flavefaciens]EWM54986.1 hypothetical protein RF007C_03045 [Ruminococcus flavefaciens 007c]